jgi:hypothetical protein
MYITPIKGNINIMGTEISVIIDDDTCNIEEADGLFQSETIYLRSEYEDIREYLRIYRHECFHALCEILGIQLDHHVEEILAHRVSHMITYEI